MITVNDGEGITLTPAIAGLSHQASRAQSLDGGMQGDNVLPFVSAALRR